MAARLLGHRANGRGVVGIDADEEVVIAVRMAADVMLQHSADDGVLAPQRHEDGDRTLPSPAKCGVARARESEIRQVANPTRVIKRSSRPLITIHTATGTRKAATQ